MKILYENMKRYDKIWKTGKNQCSAYRNFRDKRSNCIGVSLLIETFAKSGILTELEESTGFFLGNSKMRPLQLMYDLQTPAGWQLTILTSFHVYFLSFSYRICGFCESLYLNWNKKWLEYIVYS